MIGKPPLVLIIGGLDPTGGAGVFADIRALSAAKVRMATCISAITAQNRSGLMDFQTVSTDILEKQLDCVAQDHSIHAVKIGMIGGSELIPVICSFLDSQKGVPVVLDPVLEASAGGALADGGLVAHLIRDLIPRVTLLTPNLPELRVISGSQVSHAHWIEEAAIRILKSGCPSILVKGGHAPGHPFDRLLTPGHLRVFRSTRIPGSIRGTGCQLASFIAAGLALEEPLETAIMKARRYIRRLFRNHGISGSHLLGAWMPEETDGMRDGTK